MTVTLGNGRDAGADAALAAGTGTISGTIVVPPVSADDADDEVAGDGTGDEAEAGQESEEEVSGLLVKVELAVLK